MQVIWLPTSRENLTKIRRYIGLDNPIAAQRMAARIIAVGRSLESFPERGRPTGIPGTPYLLIYHVTGETARILRVWHTAQDRN